MNVHELMVSTNHRIIQEGALSKKESGEIFRALIAERDIPKWIYLRGRALQPIFYHLPPAQKPQTIFCQTPKTHILSSNMHELEMLRLLNVLAPENEQVRFMTSETLKRLRMTCFASEDDGVGECFDASLVALRFLASLEGQEDWIADRIENYKRHCDDRKRTWHSRWYYWLCLSELSDDMTITEAEPYKAQMIDMLKGAGLGISTRYEKTLRPVMLCVLRNIISKFPGYEHIKKRRPHIEDGRPHFDMD